MPKGYIRKKKRSEPESKLHVPLLFASQSSARSTISSVSLKGNLLKGQNKMSNNTVPCQGFIGVEHSTLHLLCQVLLKIHFCGRRTMKNISSYQRSRLSEVLQKAMDDVATMLLPY